MLLNTLITALLATAVLASPAPQKKSDVSFEAAKRIQREAAAATRIASHTKNSHTKSFNNVKAQEEDIARKIDIDIDQGKQRHHYTARAVDDDLEERDYDLEERDDEHQWLKRQSDNLPLAPAPEAGEGEDEGQTTAAGFAPPGSGRPGRRPARPWFRCPRYQRRPFFCYYWGFSRFSYYPCCPPPRFPPGPPRPFPYRAEGAQANAAAETPATTA